MQRSPRTYISPKLNPHRCNYINMISLHLAGCKIIVNQITLQHHATLQQRKQLIVPNPHSLNPLLKGGLQLTKTMVFQSILHSSRNRATWIGRIASPSNPSQTTTTNSTACNEKPSLNHKSDPEPKPYFWTLFSSSPAPNPQVYPSFPEELFTTRNSKHSFRNNI